MSPGKVEEHSRIATCGNDPPGRRIRLEPVLSKILVARHTLHSILSIEHVVCSTIGIEDGWRGRQLLEATSGFLATRAIAGGGQNRPAECLQFHLAASAYPGEGILLLLVHCDRPFMGPVYEVILTLVRNVRNGSIASFCPSANYPSAKNQYTAAGGNGHNVQRNFSRGQPRPVIWLSCYPPFADINVSGKKRQRQALLLDNYPRNGVALGLNAASRNEEAAFGKAYQSTRSIAVGTCIARHDVRNVGRTGICASRR